jgi:hypothetical protein
MLQLADGLLARLQIARAWLLLAWTRTRSHARKDRLLRILLLVLCVDQISR